MSVQALTRVGEFNSQELANVLWSVAVLKNVCPMEQFAHHFSTTWAEAFLAQLTSTRATPFQHMANSVWAFAQLRIDPLDGRWGPLWLCQLSNGIAQLHLSNATMVFRAGVQLLLTAFLFTDWVVCVFF